MKHMVFEDPVGAQYSVALLIKASAFREAELVSHYIDDLAIHGLSRENVIAFTLDYQDNGKAPVTFIKAYLAKLLPSLKKLGVEYLYIADSNYFKVLAGKSKAEPHVGYVLPCALEGFTDMKVVLGLNYQAMLYDPAIESRLDLSLKTLADAMQGNYQALGHGIIQKAEYPSTLEDIAAALERVKLWPTAAADIEGFSLTFHKAGIATIAFAQDTGRGIAFACDYAPLSPSDDGLHGRYVPNIPVRNLLRNFFETYPGRLRWHYSNYDLKAIIHALWMKDDLDYEGLLEGLDVMTRCFDDTKIITYLATNSAGGNTLGLKEQAHEFAGNYAQDEIKDIRKIPLRELLQYNLVDVLATNYVWDKHYPTMVDDNQLALYENLMLPSLKTIIQMEMVGLPMSQSFVAMAKAELEDGKATALATILTHPLIAQLNLLLQQNAMADANSKLKVKQHPIERFSNPASKHYTAFNPNSGPQLTLLLYQFMGLPVIDLTKTKLPATGAETLEKLINHTTNQDYKDILAALIDYGKVEKILTSFIPAFEAALDKGDGITYLMGCFNLGGTISGRLSSSDPNLQNLPSNTRYAGLVKRAFRAAMGWLFVGADFRSLEDMINALLTKDPNKLKVYTDGYDGHCLRAFAYFGDQMFGIIETVESINSIADLFPDLRQESKTPTFAKTYLGTWRTLVKNLGWSEEKAKQVDTAFDTLYAVSRQWVEDRINQASKDGYADAAFGLRIRTPILAQTVRGLKNTPHEADAEARSLGNAISGQSYGLLTNRAANEFMRRVWASEFRLRILPVAMIHDAIYLLIHNDLEVLHWVNLNLIECMQWQDLPEIQHDQVKVGASLEVYWPSWEQSVKLPNKATPHEIYRLCGLHAEGINS